MKFLLGLALVVSLAAEYNDRNGEDFETCFGTIHRATHKLVLTTTTGEVHAVKRGQQLFFPAGTTLGEITLPNKICLSQAMTRKDMVKALAAFME
ncbi:MAG: hypothetical protein LW696_01405 [Alphaproteobacteria bacterium]|nr:hypothetical protein [Alphaproteobacteria bacterium]